MPVRGGSTIRVSGRDAAARNASTLPNFTVRRGASGRQRTGVVLEVRPARRIALDRRHVSPLRVKRHREQPHSSVQVEDASLGLHRIDHGGNQVGHEEAVGLKERFRMPPQIAACGAAARQVVQGIRHIGLADVADSFRLIADRAAAQPSRADHAFERPRLPASPAINSRARAHADCQRRLRSARPTRRCSHRW